MILGCDLAGFGPALAGTPYVMVSHLLGCYNWGISLLPVACTCAPAPLLIGSGFDLYIACYT